MIRSLTASIVLLASGASAFAQPAITWYSVDSGGATRITGGVWSLGVTIGQPDAGTLSGGGFVLHGGFWGGAPFQCVADVDDGSQTGTPDGGVGIEDLLYYLNIYDQGVIAADVDDGSGTGTRDGGVGIEDLLYYLQRYDGGC